MQIVYALQEFPESWTSALFLVGPTPRGEGVESWRPEALKLLKASGYNGVVFVPEAEDGVWASNYIDQTEWEKKGLHFADVILAWVPRDLSAAGNVVFSTLSTKGQYPYVLPLESLDAEIKAKMPAFTTNVEFGRWVNSQKLVLGAPENAPKIRYLEWMYGDEGNKDKRHVTLKATVNAALARLSKPALRMGGERYIPLFLWNQPSFQSWYTNLRSAGNRLDEAQVLWSFHTFAWVLQVKVWVEEEKRHKSNEFLFSRPDISTVMLYRRPDEASQSDPSLGIENLLDTKVILVREFRSPGRTLDGYIHELPGGSSVKPGQDPLQIASEEVHEETSLKLDPDRFTFHGSRQLMGTLSAHHAFLYSADLTAEEMEEAERLHRENKTFGNEKDTERTYVEVTTVQNLLEQQIVDWSTLGMIFKGLLR